jgi:predicted metal-dependent hydrolase
MTNNTSYATSSRAWIDAAGFHLPPELTSDELKASLILLYKKAAKPHLQERVNHFARIMGVSPATIRINSAKTRWGSCSKRTGAATLNFSWRLCLATDEVIDYVVVHELAHIREMNHSAAFYAIVRQVIPNYDELRRQLRLLSRQLACEDWSS